MNQAIKTMLLSNAAAEVTKRMESFVDFDATKMEGRAFMEMAADTLGLSASEGRKAYDNGFPELKQTVLAWAEQKAQVEMTEAVREAEAEQSAHASRLANFREHHNNTMQMLADRHQESIPEGADDG